MARATITQKVIRFVYLYSTTDSRH